MKKQKPKSKRQQKLKPKQNTKSNLKMIGRRYGNKKALEAQMLMFINLIDSFSGLEDDLIHILDRVNQYLKDPLHGILEEFMLEARLGGNSDEAYETLLHRLSHTKLFDVIQALKICSEHDCNYGEVIGDLRESVEEYLSSKHTCMAIVNSARVDVLALGLGGGLVIYMLNDFLSKPLWETLTSSYIGWGILGYCALMIGITIVTVFVKEEW